MYLYGGYSGSQRLRDMHAYDFETSTWLPVDGNSVGDVPTGRSSLVAQVHENYVVSWTPPLMTYVFVPSLTFVIKISTCLEGTPEPW
jgi:Galactose oxidase, central domain